MYDTWGLVAKKQKGHLPTFAKHTRTNCASERIRPADRIILVCHQVTKLDLLGIQIFLKIFWRKRKPKKKVFKFLLFNKGSKYPVSIALWGATYDPLTG